MKPWLLRAHRNRHHVLGWHDGASIQAVLLTREEIVELAWDQMPARDRWPLQMALDDPELSADRAAIKQRTAAARHLIKRWNSHDPAIRRFRFRETWPDGEASTWLSILASYGAFKPDFAYYEAIRPQDCYVLLRKSSEALTHDSGVLNRNPAVTFLCSEVKHVFGGCSFVIITLTGGDRILLNHRSIALNPDDDYAIQFMNFEAEAIH